MAFLFFVAETFCKHDVEQNFYENMKTINSLMLLKEFEENVQTNKPA